jgi:ribonuclease III
MYLKSRLSELKREIERLDEDKFVQMFPNAKKKLLLLEAIQGHRYLSPKVALVSLVHRSSLVYWPGVKDGVIQSNERLEFLGDSLLGAFVAIEAMIGQPALDEGSLSRLRAAIVGTENLSNKAEKLGLGKCLFLGKGESASGGGKSQNILADAFEAVTAALFIDAGEQVAWQWLLGLFGSDFLVAESTLADFDAKTRFQQWTQKIIGVPPSYRVIGTESTPESTEFIIAGFIGATEVARARGKNKREASKKVAVLMQDLVVSGQLTEERIKEMYDFRG